MGGFIESLPFLLSSHIDNNFRNNLSPIFGRNVFVFSRK